MTPVFFVFICKTSGNTLKDERVFAIESSTFSLNCVIYLL